MSSFIIPKAREVDGEDLRGIESPLGNRLYRYELDNSNNNNNNNNSNSNQANQ